ncbi:hypothetical protein [Embleya sp. NPDC001921]
MTEPGSAEPELTDDEKQINRRYRLDDLLQDAVATAFTGSVLAAISDDRLAPDVNRALEARARELGESAAARAEEARTVLGDFMRHEVSTSLEMDHDRPMTADEAARFDGWMRTPDGNNVEGYAFPPRTFPVDRIADARPMADEVRRAVAEHGDAVPAARLPAVIENTVRSHIRLDAPVGNPMDAHLYDAMASHLVREPGAEVDPRIQQVYARRGSVFQQHMSGHRVIPPVEGRVESVLARDLASLRSSARTPAWEWQRYAPAAEQSARSAPASAPSRAETVNTRALVTATGFTPAKDVPSKVAPNVEGETNHGVPTVPAVIRSVRAGRETSGP